MTDKIITIKFTVPKLTKDKIHTVVIEDHDLGDTWTSVQILEGADDYTHDLNAWADSLGSMDMLKVSVYPFIHNEDGTIDTDYGNPVPCIVLDVKGDNNISTRHFKSVKHYGYRKKSIKSFF